ncbi:MAG: hypothetical protein Kow0069_30990 [Promethearchaeota archaeon]
MDVVGAPEDLKRELLPRVHQVLSRTILERPPEFAPGLEETLRQLKDRGYLLGFVSNTSVTPGATFRELFARRGLLDLFDSLTFSDEVLLLKPNPRVFELAAERLGVATGQLLHVGDGPLTDVEGAQAAGALGAAYTGLYHAYHDERERQRNLRLLRERVRPDFLVREHPELLSFL